MVKVTIKEIMDKKQITRYKLQQLTNWNYKRINALYLNQAKQITFAEIQTLCDIFECEIKDILRLE